MPSSTGNSAGEGSRCAQGRRERAEQGTDRHMLGRGHRRRSDSLGRRGSLIGPSGGEAPSGREGLGGRPLGGQQRGGGSFGGPEPEPGGGGRGLGGGGGGRLGGGPRSIPGCLPVGQGLEAP